ncbi:MAG: CoA-binding protein [Verrucomicrobiota bacterium]|jgi:predicted CoA-binding protein
MLSNQGVGSLSIGGREERNQRSSPRPLYEPSQPGDSAGMKTVAVIGASADPAKFGNKAVRAYQQQGYQVFPVNPKATELQGLPVFPSISAVPVRPNLVSVYLPPALLLKVLPEIATKGCDELWLNPGTKSPEVLAEAERLSLNVVQACSIVGLGLSPSQL